MNIANVPPFLKPSAATLETAGISLSLYISFLGNNFVPDPGTCPVKILVMGLTTVALAALPPYLKTLPVPFKPNLKPAGAALPINPHVAPILVPSKPNLNLFFNLATAKALPSLPSSPSNFISGLSINPQKSGALIVSPLFPTTNSAAPKLAALKPTLKAALVV